MAKNDYKEFCKWLKKTNEEVAKDLEELTFNYGADIQAKMKERAPVDTGHLERNIILENLTPLSIKIHSVAEYSAYVEFGTSRSRSQPFFFNTFDEYKDDYVKTCEEILTQLFK